MSGSVNGTATPFLSLLHRHCRNRQGNLSSTPLPLSSTEEDPEVKDTDFGAVMYITAVLIFYSLGIVVMIIKYLKTERKEMEEELALESFFKGIPSKKLEHERDAVNRVAIRAFHTLTSGATRQDEMLIAAETAKQGPRGTALDPDLDFRGKEGAGSDPDDSDSSIEDHSPSLLHRERSKYLPRVSLMFRDSRSSDRRKMQDNLLKENGQFPIQNNFLPGQRSSKSATCHITENGQVGGFLDIPRDLSDQSDSSAASRTDNGSIVSESVKQRPRKRDFKKLRNGDTARSASVRFKDEEKAGENRASFIRTRNRSRSSKSLQGNLKNSTTSEDHRGSLTHNDSKKDNKSDTVRTSTADFIDTINKPTEGNPVGASGDIIGSPTKVTAKGEGGGDCTITVVNSCPEFSSKGLLVSDV